MRSRSQSRVICIWHQKTLNSYCFHENFSPCLLTNIVYIFCGKDSSHDTNFHTWIVWYVVCFMFDYVYVLYINVCVFVYVCVWARKSHDNNNDCNDIHNSSKRHHNVHRISMRHAFMFQPFALSSPYNKNSITSKNICGRPSLQMCFATEYCYFY